MKHSIEQEGFVKAENEHMKLTRAILREGGASEYELEGYELTKPIVPRIN